MSAQTDRADIDTLRYIVRCPGSKRNDAFVRKASVARLIHAGLIGAPSTNGKLYATEAGRAAAGN